MNNEFSEVSTEYAAVKEEVEDLQSKINMGIQMLVSLENDIRELDYELKSRRLAEEEEQADFERPEVAQSVTPP